MQDEHIINEIENRLPKENPFSVPDGYFDRFALRMSEKIADEKQGRRFPFPSLLKPAPLLAFASITLLVGMFALKIFNRNPIELSDEEVSRYVYQEGIDELDLDEIIEYSELGYSDTVKHPSNNKNKQQTKKESEIDEIQKYLLDEDIDLSDIINEL
jgi:hypothetical protein